MKNLLKVTTIAATLFAIGAGAATIQSQMFRPVNARFAPSTVLVNFDAKTGKASSADLALIDTSHLVGIKGLALNTTAKDGVLAGQQTVRLIGGYTPITVNECSFTNVDKSHSVLDCNITKIDAAGKSVHFEENIAFMPTVSVK